MPYCSSVSQLRSWSEKRTRQVGERVRKLRGKRSAQWLADRCADLGHPISRSAIAKLENGRREDVTLSELLIFAAALDAPPGLLMFPVGDEDDVELLPGQKADPWTAYLWLLGEMPTSELGKQPRLDITWFAPSVTVAYRRHDNGLRSYLHYKGGDGALATIVGARVEMQQEGWWRPPLPDEVTEAIRPVLLAFGWREDPPGELSRVAGADVSEGAS